MLSLITQTGEEERVSVLAIGQLSASILIPVIDDISSAVWGSQPTETGSPITEA